MMSNQIKKMHISELRQGDTVLIDGEMQTVAKHHLTLSPLFGNQYKGFNHRDTEGYLDVVLFPKYYQGAVVGYVTQI